MDQVGFRRIVFHDQEAQALAHLVTPLGGGLKKEKPKFRDGLEPAFNVPARRFGTRSNDTPIARSASTTTARKSSRQPMMTNIKLTIHQSVSQRKTMCLSKANCAN
jgi:hypothetical protein